MICLTTTSTFDEQGGGLVARMESQGWSVVLNPVRRKLTEQELIALFEEYRPTAMIAGTEPITERALSAASGLKVISRCGVGMDSVDLKAAEKLGIRVTNTPDAPTAPVAELTLGLMLSLLRQIPAYDQGVRSGSWDRRPGSMLKGKTVGIIGCGRIGRYVGRLLDAFGCDIIGHDVAVVPEAPIKPVTLDVLLESADIVTLHMPTLEDGSYLLDRARLDRLKPGAFLINAARGGLIDETYLFEMLQSGRLGGAALDCFADEPYSGPLAGLSNVVLTAHTGSFTREARVEMEREAVDNLLRAYAESAK